MANLFPTADEIADDFEAYAPALTSVTVEKVNPDTAAIEATATEVPCLKRVHVRATANIGDGQIPDEHCRFWLLSRNVPFEINSPHRIVDADGITWFVNFTEARALGAVTLADTTRSRS